MSAPSAPSAPSADESAGAPAVLDARGLSCPLPVLKARKAMRGVPRGGLLKVLADDPAAPGDFAAFCEIAGHRLESSDERGGAWTFLIRARS